MFNHCSKLFCLSYQFAMYHFLKYHLEKWRKICCQVEWWIRDFLPIENRSLRIIWHHGLRHSTTKASMLYWLTKHLPSDGNKRLNAPKNLKQTFDDHSWFSSLPKIPIQTVTGKIFASLCKFSLYMRKNSLCNKEQELSDQKGAAISGKVTKSMSVHTSAIESR